MSEWVECPICGESDMRCERDAHEPEYKQIFCTNLACGSNGGDNFSAVNAAENADMDLMLRAIAVGWTVEPAQMVADSWAWRNPQLSAVYFVPRSPSSLRPEITDEIRELMEKSLG